MNANGMSFKAVGWKRNIELVFENLFPLPKTQSKNLLAPLLKERAEYISHLLRQGRPLHVIKFVASMQVNAIKLLNLKEPRLICRSEVEDSGSAWANEKELHRHNPRGKTSAYNFTRIVTKWLTFSDLLVRPEHPGLPFDEFVRIYLQELRSVRSLAASTIYRRHRHLMKLQRWLGDRHGNFTEQGLKDIDEYLDMLRIKDFRPSGRLAVALAIRDFFRFCAVRGW